MRNSPASELRVGVVGCGSIARAYMHNAPCFRGVRIVACADLVHDAATRRAAEFGLWALPVDDLLDHREVDLVLNLTVPAAHFDVSMRALAAGKHVFTEKPLAATADEGRRLMAEAAKRGLAVGAAPDTFLGAAGRLARRLVDEGAIGAPVTGTAFMLGRGMEHWHPDPAFYYQAGAGPVLDMGPYYLSMLVNLIGPIRRVQAAATVGQDERMITAPGPNSGLRFKVGTPTSVLSLLEFACGAIVTFGASWDVFRHSNWPIELHGTSGSLRLPDPDNFGGLLAVSDGGATWAEIDPGSSPFGAPNWPPEAPDRANYRMLGFAEMGRALADGRSPRASGSLALHVLETMEAILRAAETGAAQAVAASCIRPEPFDEADAAELVAPPAASAPHDAPSAQ